MSFKTITEETDSDFISKESIEGTDVKMEKINLEKISSRELDRGYAWVTLATNDSYSLGALVLANSLRRVGTVHQLAVLITPGVTNSMREKLSSVFNVVKEVNILDSKDQNNLRLLQRPELGITFTKLNCWRLTQFDKCVFLDADTLVLQNADELFEREEFSAAPDVGWPDCFNSGVYVYRPSEATYDNLVKFALQTGSFDGADQGLLNLYFNEWAHKDISKHLPFIYNVCSTATYSYIPAFKQYSRNIKIIHFIGNSKPWLQHFDFETLNVQINPGLDHLHGITQQWWEIFCSSVHPVLSQQMVLQNADELFEREEFSAAPDVGWPDCFDSGVYVDQPSEATYDNLVKFALQTGSKQETGRNESQLDHASEDVTRQCQKIIGEILEKVLHAIDKQEVQNTISSVELELGRKEEISEFLRVPLQKEEVEALKERLQNLLKTLEDKEDEVRNYRNILNNYQTTFADNWCTLTKLKEEHETSKKHLANVELAFSDVHEKYERCKDIIKGFSNNEATLRYCLTTAENNLQKSEEKYEKLKAHALAQIEKGNQEYQMVREQRDTEVHKLNAIIKRSEIKKDAVVAQLDQKTKECAALSLLCDEVTGRV